MTSTELADAVIIEAAINGATPKSRNATVPRTPPEIAEDGLRCLEAGAAIVHNHNDEPVVGDAPEHDPAPYLEAWNVILAERPDALLYPTMPSGGPPAICVASSTARASRSSTGTTSSTRPRSSASCASIRRAVKMSSSARWRPTCSCRK